MNNNSSNTGVRNSSGQGKQIGKTGLDFNFTQPIQLTANLTGGGSNTTGKANGKFGQTQAGLQKILRSLNKQQPAAV